MSNCARDRARTRLLLSRTRASLAGSEVHAMPLYEYELREGTCAACLGRFTLRRPLSAPELTACPACKKPIRKLISGFNTPSITKPVSISDAKKAGFTVMKRVNKGEYERL